MGTRHTAASGPARPPSVSVAPWSNLQARVALVRDALIRGDRVAAARLLEELEIILTTTPGGSRVQQQLTNLRPAHQKMRDRTATFGPASLSTAELRVLQWLPTHLSFVQIGERLYLSRHTVKTQALSIYRKLGTSSRSGAVELALDAGLLPASPSPP